ncbi:Hypothetical predicted protein [Paramuricea clavata]|uniref:Uncharacterized protein n=1 Tax=Paramuricea clavata TaxID=317549 RepID=A0A7D9EC76_PARCT|nr:Hypothetical predicted protein [Paramuricea clavata]
MILSSFVKKLSRSLSSKERLKERLLHSYPQLVFITLKRRNVSEIVFPENLCPIDLEEYDPNLYPSSEKDTKTGKETTHVAGAIIIQREHGEIESQTTSRENIPKASSLYHVPDQIAPYTLGKKVTVDLRNALEDIDLSEKAHEQPQSYGNKLEFSFIVNRMMQTDTHLPNCIGKVTTHYCELLKN